jgi:hypothetical protein
LRLGASYKRLGELSDGERIQKIARRILNLATKVEAALIRTTGKNRLSLIVKGQVIPIPTS